MVRQKVSGSVETESLCELSGLKEGHLEEVRGIGGEAGRGGVALFQIRHKDQ